MPNRGDRLGRSNLELPTKDSWFKVHRFVAITLYHSEATRWGYSIRLAGIVNRLRPHGWSKKWMAEAAAKSRIDRHFEGGERRHGYSV